MKDLSEKTNTKLKDQGEKLQSELNENTVRIKAREPSLKKEGKSKNARTSPQNLQNSGKKFFKEAEIFEATLRSISVGVITTDNKGQIILLNKTAENITGWTQEEALGRHAEEVFIIIDERTNERIPTSIIKVLKSRKIDDHLVYKCLLSKQGEIKNISDSAAPIRNKNGKITGSIVVFRDISRQKFAERKLRESEESYRTLFEAANDAILISEDGIFIDCNQ